MNVVVAELDGGDFDGYLDMENDYEVYTNKRKDGAVEGDEERTEKDYVYIGTNRDRE